MELPLPPLPPQLPTLPPQLPPLGPNNPFPMLIHEMFCDHCQRTQVIIDNFHDEMRKPVPLDYTADSIKVILFKEEIAKHPFEMIKFQVSCFASPLHYQDHISDSCTSYSSCSCIHHLCKPSVVILVLFYLVKNPISSFVPLKGVSNVVRYYRIQKGHRCYSPQLHRYLVSRDVTFHEDLPYFSVNTYRHQEKNDDLLVYVSLTPVATTKQSTEPDGLPLKVYVRRPRITSNLVREPSSQLKDAPIDAPNNVSNDVPISTPNSVSAFVSYDGLSISSRAFVANLDSILVSKTVGEALAHSGLCAAMIEEMIALDHNDTWDLVDLPIHKNSIGCKWVFSVKMNPDGSITRLKARLAAKGYAQTYAIYYSETFSPVTKISSIRLFISLAATYDWALHQLDVKNAFLHDDLQEEVYMEPPPRFVARGESRSCILLVVYVDDIVITGSDKDLLDDVGQIEAKLYDESMIPKLKLKYEDERLLQNLEKYRRIVGKLNYLTITRLDIAFMISVGTPGLGLLYDNHGHCIAEGFTNADYAGCPNTSRSTTGNYVFVGGNIVSWKCHEFDENEIYVSSIGGGHDKEEDDLNDYDGYEAQVYDLPEHMQSCCDRFDIRLKGRIRKYGSGGCLRIVLDLICVVEQWASLLKIKKATWVRGRGGLVLTHGLAKVWQGSFVAQVDAKVFLVVVLLVMYVVFVVQVKTVYKGRKKKSIEYFAIKSVDKSHKSKVLQEWLEDVTSLTGVIGCIWASNAQERRGESKEEVVRILHSLDHPNVLKFYSWYETSAHLWLVLEYCVGGDLRTLLEQDSKLPENSVHDLARDLVRGLRFLHSKGIIYCDLKPSNILLDENGRTKLCDFGLSRKLSDISKTPSSLLPQAKRGTPCYMAPELFHDGGVHSYASDFWALGCVLYECYAGRPPFVGKEFTQLVKSILTDPTPSLPGNPSRSFANLVSSLLIKDPSERIQWSEVCSHAYWNTKLSPLPLPPQPAFDNMIELCYKPCLAERNSDKQNKTPPRNRDNLKGTVGSNENSNYSTPNKGVSGGRKIQSKGSGNTKGVNLLRLSRIAKSNLQRENEKENYRRPLPNNSENDTDVKIENTDMELDFNENNDDDSPDEPEMVTPARTVDHNSSIPDQEEVSPVVTTPITDDSRRTDHESSFNYAEVPATPPSASPNPKTQKIIDNSDGGDDIDSSKSAPNLSTVLWHSSDLSVRPVMPSKKSDKGSEVLPSLPFEAIPASDFVKIPKDQLDVLTKSIINILNGNTTIGEKQNVMRYLEILSCNVDAANILTNGQMMPVLVKMLRQSKASALRVQLASLLGLLIRHSTFINDDLANSGILGSLNEGLVDRQEKVRRFSMAALGELLFYISTQNDQLKATNPPESPSKESKTSSGWQLTGQEGLRENSQGSNPTLDMSLRQEHIAWGWSLGKGRSASKRCMGSGCSHRFTPFAKIFVYR
ncbi:serine/threonine-protein kinase RUNKEL [Tanacetum coccineum]